MQKSFSDSYKAAGVDVTAGYRAVELMKRLGLSHRPTFRKNYLDPALNAHMIVRTIPDKPNSFTPAYTDRSMKTG